MPQKVGEHVYYPIDEAKETILGPIGTEIRDKYEDELAEELKNLENVEI
jgi:hypothetical protein